MPRRFPIFFACVGSCAIALSGCDATGSSSSDSNSPKDTVSQDGGKNTPDPDPGPADPSLPGAKATIIDTASFGMPAVDTVGETTTAWFRVEVQKDSVYSIAGSGLPGLKGVGKTDIKLTVYSQASDLVLASVDDVGASRDPVAVVKAPASGYLRVKVEVGKSGMTGAFSLVVTKSDRWETNDSQLESSPLDGNGFSISAIMEPSGVDWFVLRTKPGSVYRVVASDPWPSITLRGRSGDSLVPAKIIDEDTAEGVLFLATDTVSWVQLRPASRFASPIAQTYRFSGSLRVNDTFELDNDYATAKVVRVVNGTKPGYVDYDQRHSMDAFDVDYIKIPVKKGHIYRNEISTGYGALDAWMIEDTLDGRVSDEVGYRFQIESSSSYRGHTVAKSDGFMYLRLKMPQIRLGEDFWPSELVNTYTYKVTETEFPPDTYEPDSRTSCAKLSSGQVPSNRFIQYQEVDWYCFDAVAGGQYTLTLSDPEYSRFSMVLRNEAGDSIGAPTTGKAFKTSEAGAYTISLTARDEGPYSLSLSGTGTVVDPVDPKPVDPDPTKPDTSDLDTGLVRLEVGGDARTLRFDAEAGLSGIFSATNSVSYTIHVVPSEAMLFGVYDPFTQDDIGQKVAASGIESTLTMDAETTQLYGTYLFGTSGIVSARVWVTSP